jgi:saccharopine dehydrogenase-like NADP-dependent oxidoreductase
MYNITMGLNKDDLAMVNGVLMRVDTSYLKTGKGDYDRIQWAFTSILKSMRFLGFFDDSQKLKVVKNKEGKNSSCLDAFGEIMA